MTEDRTDDVIEDVIDVQDDTCELRRAPAHRERRSPLTLPVVAVLAAAIVAAAGCGSDADDGTAGAGTDDAPTIVATTTIWADVVDNVACDGLAEVVAVVPPGGDPHGFEPSLRDRETMENAVLVVANGLGLEEGLADTIDSVEASGVTVVRVADAVDTLRAGSNTHADESADDGAATTDTDHDTDTENTDDHSHEGDDPHIWFDPTRVATAIPAIADALVSAGLDPTTVEGCVESYTSELVALDGDVEAALDVVPPERRLLVTNHDSLRYFADRYDFEILGSVIPSSSSLAGTNPRDLEELARVIEQTGVPAIFAETQYSAADAEALAERVGDVSVVTLQTSTLGEPGSSTDTYVTWLTTTAEQIAEALS